MTDRELMQEALYALTYVGDAKEIYSDTIESLRARLAQPEQEPLAWWQPNEYKIEKSFSWHKKGGFIKPLYTAPPQREPLTDEQITAIVREAAKGNAIRRDGSTSHRIARAIERAHGIGGEV